MRLGIVGSRRRSTLSDMRAVMDIVDAASCYALSNGSRLVVVSGACSCGADAFAANAARLHGIELVEFPIDRSSEISSRQEFVRRAFSRNSLIASGSDALVALASDDRTGGTEDTVRKALSLGRPVCLLMSDMTYIVMRDEASAKDAAEAGCSRRSVHEQGWKVMLAEILGPR